MSTEIKIGFFTIGVLAVFAFFTANVGYLRMPWEKKGPTYSTYLTDVVGLERGATARIAGIRKGRVTAIELNGIVAKVTMQFDPDVVLREGTEAKIGTMGLMGEKYVDIVPGPVGKPQIAEGAEISGRPSGSIDALVDSMQGIGDDVKAITAAVRESVASEEGVRSLKNVIARMDSITEKLDGTVGRSQGDIEAIIKDFRATAHALRTIIETNQQSTSNTLQNFEAITGTLRKDLPNIMERMGKVMERLDILIAQNQEQVNKTIGNVADASTDLKETMSSVKSIAGKIDNGEGTLGALVNDDTTQKKINQTLTTLNSTLEDAKDMLGRVSRIETSLGYRAEMLEQSDDTKSYITLRLAPRQDKYFMLELVDDPAGYTKEETIITDTTSSVTGTEHIKTTRKKTTDRFKISAQVARRIYGFTFRGGLLESEGGAGIDYEVWDDRLKVSTEAWNFGEDNLKPHLKVAGQFYVLPNIFLRAGYDDVLNKDRDSFFAGGGLLYTDQDLKYLLGLLSLGGGLR